MLLVAKALADATRLAMLRDLLSCDEAGRTCSCMCAKFPISQPTVSHHVRVLQKAGLIEITPEGPYHRLSARRDVLEAFFAGLGQAAPAPTRPAPRRRTTRAKRAV